MSKADISQWTHKMNALKSAYRKLPDEIAAIAVEFSKERFRDQAWLDSTKERWKPRKQRRRGGTKRSQTLLVDTGRLKRSIRKISANADRIVIGSDVPYASIHNYGGTITGTFTVRAHTVKAHRRRAHTRVRSGRTEKIKTQTVRSHMVKSHSRKVNMRIPQRQFLGNSYTLRRRIYLLTASRFSRALKQ
ncbi:phage virion morphogenesis protein [Proteiniphilum sp.]|uniref:phage virion morphogenesis protein n=1 Tax=Proteiniphilum sp. TaxID=1926877 RepID=UPI002B218832|nr:phage virion morphogenesis protein [Proteiniphilum sp.]MEA4916558.1 phage virion morphogenesis protein [Proteiniphilum sp.]